MSCVIGVPDSYRMQKVKVFRRLEAEHPAYAGHQGRKLELCRKNVAKYAMCHTILNSVTSCPKRLSVR